MNSSYFYPAFSMPTSSGPTRTFRSCFRHTPYATGGRYGVRRQLDDRLPNFAGMERELRTHRGFPTDDYGSTTNADHSTSLYASESLSHPTSLPASSWSSLSAMIDYKTWENQETSSRLANGPGSAQRALLSIGYGSSNVDASQYPPITTYRMQDTRCRTSQPGYSSNPTPHHVVSIPTLETPMVHHGLLAAQEMAFSPHSSSSDMQTAEYAYHHPPPTQLYDIPSHANKEWDTLRTPESDRYCGTPPLSPSSSTSTPSTSITSLDELPTTPALRYDFAAPEVEVEVVQDMGPYSPSLSSLLATSSWTTKEQRSAFIPSNTNALTPLPTSQSYGGVPTLPQPPFTPVYASPPSLSQHSPGFSSSYAATPSDEGLWDGYSTSQPARSLGSTPVSPSTTTTASLSLSSFEATPKASFRQDSWPAASASRVYPSATDEMHQTRAQLGETSACTLGIAHKLENHPSIVQARMGETKIYMSGQFQIPPTRSPCHNKAVEPAEAGNPKTSRGLATRKKSVETSKKQRGRPPQPYEVRFSSAGNYNKKHHKSNARVKGMDYIRFYYGPKNA